MFRKINAFILQKNKLFSYFCNRLPKGMSRHRTRALLKLTFAINFSQILTLQMKVGWQQCSRYGYKPRMVYTPKREMLLLTLSVGNVRA